jgi:hypothetical protein
MVINVAVSLFNGILLAEDWEYPNIKVNYYQDVNGI